MKKVMTIFVKRRLSWTPYWIFQNAQGWPKSTRRILKIDHLGYPKPSRKKLTLTFPGSAKICHLAPGLNQMTPPCAEWWDESYYTTGQPHLSVIVQTWRFFPCGHIARMSDETDAKKILTAVPLENWRRPPGRPRTTWMKTIQQDLKYKQTSPWAKRSSWIRIVHSGDWCLHLALRTNGGACHKRRRRRRCVILGRCICTEIAAFAAWPFGSWNSTCLILCVI